MAAPTRRFGTDGIRGIANAELTPELALALGRGAARVIGGQRFLIGRDPRRSGPLLANAFAAGVGSEGIDAIDLGVIPTPGVAFISAVERQPAAMVSASHNPFSDNGIKLFLAGGKKLPDATELAIEMEIDAILAGRTLGGPTPPVGSAVGLVARASTEATANGQYGTHLVESMDGRRLDGMTVVLDCANGAASDTAPEIWRRLGAKVHVIHASPDGLNINEACGSTHPQSLQAAVLEHRADIGLAFDGDSDRVLAVDARGGLVDGDQILALSALELRRQDRLAHDTVVVTVMSNLGFRLAMEAAGVKVVETAVGDRYVLEAMEEGGYSLGGEQSGHVIFRQFATTGDGLLTGLVLCDLVRRSGAPLGDLVNVMTKLPQVLRAVRDVDKSRLPGAEAVWTQVRAVETEFAGRGRVLIRPSGTEPVVRVMVEAPTMEIAEAACNRLCYVVETELRR